MNLKDKIDAALTIDPIFEGYQVMWTVAEVMEYVKKIPSLGKADCRTLARLIQGINKALLRRRVRYVFHIGREGGRLLTVDMFKEWNPKHYKTTTWPVMNKFQALAVRAGCNRFENRMVPGANRVNLGTDIFRFGWK